MLDTIEGLLCTFGLLIALVWAVIDLIVNRYLDTRGQ